MTTFDDQTANHLDASTAGGHKDWKSRFNGIPQADQDKENKLMTEIIGLLPTPINDRSMDKSKMASIINPEETTVFLGLDPSGKSNILLHNVEILPTSRHQKKALIRALHGFGESATIVILEYFKRMTLTPIQCGSLTNIKKFVGHEKLENTIPRTDK
jgi:hypothetical protein